MIITSTISPALKISLRLFGVWPGMSHSIYWLIYIPTTLIIQYFQYLYVIKHNELSDLVDCLPEALSYSLTFVKMISLWVHRRVARHVLIAIDNDWHDNIDQHLYMMTIKASISHFYSNTILSLNMIAITFYLFSGYAIRALHFVQNYNDTLWHLPLKIELPLETEHSLKFQLIGLILTIHIFLSIFALSTINALIFSLVFHVSGQIDIICQELRAIHEKRSLSGSSAFKLETLIERHNRVISFSDNIEKLFSFIALMQTFWNTLVICCLGFIVIISIHAEDAGIILMKTLLVYIAINIDTFVFCFAGEYLSLKSSSIADAAYESLWYDMPSNQAKIISFIMVRSQKPLTITAGKITILSLESFTDIIKASVSYVSVLYAMY